MLELDTPLHVTTRQGARIYKHTNNSLVHTVANHNMTSNESRSVTEWLKSAAYPQTLFESACNGAVQFTGPERLSCRSMSELCAKNKKQFSALIDLSAASCCVHIYEPTQWKPTIQAKTKVATATTVMQHFTDMSKSTTNISILPQKRSGPTQIVKILPDKKHCTMRVLGTDINEVLSQHGVLDIVLKPDHLLVILAGNSEKIGSLSHISHTSTLRARMFRCIPPTHPKATKCLNSSAKTKSNWFGKNRRAGKQRRHGKIQLR